MKANALKQSFVPTNNQMPGVNGRANPVRTLPTKTQPTAPSFAPSVTPHQEAQQMGIGDVAAQQAQQDAQQAQQQANAGAMQGVNKVAMTRGDAVILADLCKSASLTGYHDLGPIPTPQYGAAGGFGTPVHTSIGEIARDPYLNPFQKARAATILQGANDTGGRTGVVSKGDIARAAVGYGVGYAAGTLFAKTVDGIFGGLSHKTRKRLSQVGGVAGLLKNTGVLD
jgi:hypothetical protein